MKQDPLVKKAGEHLTKLCTEIDNRRVGSPGNQEAVAYFGEIARQNGFETELPAFECMDWNHAEVLLEAVGERYEAIPSPYSLGCHVRALLETAASIEELRSVDASGKILLLHGELAREQLMPKNFPFYNPEYHQEIIALLEDKSPLAIIAATGKNPELAGGMYPFPLIEDGDFDIPSVFMKDAEGERLLAKTGQLVTLVSQATRIPSSGSNLIARKSAGAPYKICLCAHIDAKINSPGALDNAGGTTVLLLLLELLKSYQGGLGVEIIAFNGEDYFSAPGQVQYIQFHGAKFEEIILAVNLDGVGFIRGKDAYSIYDCPEGVAEIIRTVFGGLETLVEGPLWYQSDHSIFIRNGVPAMALTTDQFDSLWTEITHTEKDTPDLVDPVKLVQLSMGLKDLIYQLNRGG